MKLNKGARKRFAKRIGPDTRIDAIIALGRQLSGPGQFVGGSASPLQTYRDATNVSDTLAPEHPTDQQWCVLTDRRVLFFLKKTAALSLYAAKGPLEHELDRATVSLRWGDYTGGPANMRVRLMHIAGSDGRATVQHTDLGSAARKINHFDEADLFVQSLGDQALEIEVPPHANAH